MFSRFAQTNPLPVSRRYSSSKMLSYRVTARGVAFSILETVGLGASPCKGVRGLLIFFLSLVLIFLSFLFMCCSLVAGVLLVCCWCVVCLLLRFFNLLIRIVFTNGYDRIFVCYLHRYLSALLKAVEACAKLLHGDACFFAEMEVSGDKLSPVDSLTVPLLLFVGSHDEQAHPEGDHLGNVRPFPMQQASV